MIVGGLDWSMGCPAICIYNTKDKFEFKNCTFFFYIDKKKFDQSYGNIHGFKTELYDSEEERFDKISEWGIQILLKHNVKSVCLEGYSMGSQGRIFNIAENIGLLKHKMWKAGIEFITPAPTAVKKHFTGKGNSNKDAMYNALQLLDVDLDLETLLSSKSKDSPIADIVDSFAMVSYMLNNMDSKV